MPGFILRERERYKNPFTGGNKWEEQRVFISDVELRKLYTLLRQLNGDL